jgi:phage-related minor tail protein
MDRSYLVGERGPELFTPGRSGMITPNGAGKSVVIHSAPVINVNASQLTQDQAARMVADSQRMMWDELDRRYGLA